MRGPARRGWGGAYGCRGPAGLGGEVGGIGGGTELEAAQEDAEPPDRRRAGRAPHISLELTCRLPARCSCDPPRQLIAGIYALTIYASIFRADQFAAYIIAAWPFCPTLTGLRGAMDAVCARRAEGAAAVPDVTMEDDSTSGDMKSGGS